MGLEIENFLSQLSEEDRALFQSVLETVSKADKTVKAEIGNIMGGQPGLVFNQEGVFKYGLAKTTKHYTFHSMVMYAFPELLEELKSKTKGIKFQKGCFNFSSPERLEMSVFQEFMQHSSEKDFMPIVRKYQAKKK